MSRVVQRLALVEGASLLPAARAVGVDTPAGAHIGVILNWGGRHSNGLANVHARLYSPPRWENPWTVATHRFDPLLKHAGLPQVRFHDLRHTCATLLLSKNLNPKVVSEMLGHATIAITLDTYSHVLPDMQDSAAAAMDSALA